MNMAESANFQHLLRGELKRDEPMSRHVSWRAGGAARQFYKPADLADLQAFLQTLPPQEDILFVGLGSNLLVRDGGFNGTVVLTTPVLSGLELDPSDAQVVIEGAGVASPHVAKFVSAMQPSRADWQA